MSIKEIKTYLDQFDWEEFKKDVHGNMDKMRAAFPDASDFEYSVAFITWLNENRDDGGYSTVEYTVEDEGEKC